MLLIQLDLGVTWRSDLLLRSMERQAKHPGRRQFLRLQVLEQSRKLFPEGQRPSVTKPRVRSTLGRLTTHHAQASTPTVLRAFLAWFGSQAWGSARKRITIHSVQHANASQTGRGTPSLKQTRNSVCSEGEGARVPHCFLSLRFFHWGFFHFGREGCFSLNHSFTTSIKCAAAKARGIKTAGSHTISNIMPRAKATLRANSIVVSGVGCGCARPSPWPLAMSVSSRMSTMD